MSNWSDEFGYERMQDFVKYLATYNCESQVLAVDANANDIQSTGTKLAFINGVPYRLAEDAALDISEDTATATDMTNAKGTIITTAYEQWFCVLATTAGVLSIWRAGVQALTSSGAVCKIPKFDPATYVCIGLIHVANATGSNFVVGTTSFSVSNATTTYHQVTGPVLPHIDNM